MELKEAILSTLAELQDSPMANPEESSECTEQNKECEEIDSQESANLNPVSPMVVPDPYEAQNGEESELNISERQFLEAMRERILVLFEGMQSPNNRSVEAKVELSLNFFDYLLSVIDERLLGKK
ncbi:MAG: CiaD-like domain-containing protein [Wolinella sp.]